MESEKIESINHRVDRYEKILANLFNKYFCSITTKLSREI